MKNFAIIRLGKDSVADIKKLDELHGSPGAPIALTVNCTQVPQELTAGDFAFFCLGSDNNKGIPTAWERGVRALGTVTSKTGGPAYNDTWVVAVEIKVVLPKSIGQKQLLAQAPTAYYWCSDIPVLGVDTHSNQTVQMIKEGEPHQNVKALAYSLSEIFPTFRHDTLTSYPELKSLFEYKPPSPTGLVDANGGAVTAVAGDGLPDLVTKFLADAELAGVRVDKRTAHRLFASLLSKRFLIATGLAGSGKTQLALAVARWIAPVSAIDDPFRPGTRYESDRVTYVVKKADSIAIEFWTEEGEGGATKNMVPREIVEEWADYIDANRISDDASAQAISDAVEPNSRFSAYLHRFRAFLKLAAFALLKARRSAVPVKCYEVVPVGADWTGNENVLGYPNGLENGSYVTKPALDVVLRARDQPAIPHFLILDEMNLSHVERYFSDILSSIESEEEIHLYHDAERQSNGAVVPERLVLPKNLFIIGTVNVDETTYMFSPKVLDRANVVEFRMEPDEFSAFLAKPDKPDLSKLDGQGASFGKAFVNAAIGAVQVPSDTIAAYEAEMLLFFNALRGHNAEFGYRVAHEAARFIHFYGLLGAPPSGDTSWFSDAYDCVVFQKFLPKLHGSRAKLGPLLKALWFLSVNNAAGRGIDALGAAQAAARSGERKDEPSFEIPAGAPYALSAEKIARMWRLLNENGFASFAEA